MTVCDRGPTQSPKPFSKCCTDCGSCVPKSIVPAGDVSLLGKVTCVAEFPSTSRGMTRLLGNEALVTKLMQQGPPIQVNVALERDPSTPTGYRWSSSRGPSLKISSGTLASGDIVVQEDRPFRLVIPKVREATGL